MSTKDKIKQVALQLFAEKGFVGMTMSEIAKEVGIKAPSIYAFYKNKQDIFLELYNDVLKEHSTTITRDVCKDRTVKEQLYELLKSAIDYQYISEFKNQVVIRLISFPPDFLEEEILEKFHKLEANEKNYIEKILKYGIDQDEVSDIDISDMSQTLLCLMDGLFWEMQRLSKEQVYQRLDSVFTIYWNGIEKR